MLSGYIVFHGGKYRYLSEIQISKTRHVFEVLHHIFGGLGGILTRAFKQDEEMHDRNKKMWDWRG